MVGAQGHRTYAAKRTGQREGSRVLWGCCQNCIDVHGEQVTSDMAEARIIREMMLV